MSTFAVILITLTGLALMEPTEEQAERSAHRGGELQQRLALLRELGLLRR